MPTERAEANLLPDLTPNQVQAKKQILNLLKSFSPTKKALVVVEGFSGVGKSFVLQHLEAEAMEKKFITPGERRDIQSLLGQIISDASCAGAVISVGPGETRLGKENIDFLASQAGLKTISVILPGMDRKETEEYLKKNFLTVAEAPLSKDQLARYSLGIPLLARRLVEGAVNDQQAIELVAEYLYEVTPKALLDPEVGVLENFRQGFFRQPFPQEIITRLTTIIVEKRKQFLTEGIRSYLAKTRDRWNKLKEEGIDEIPATPLTEETTQMYILSAINRPEAALFGMMRHIEILAPGLSQETFEKIQHSLGFEVGRYGKPEKIPRGKIFTIEDDRLIIAAFTTDGTVYLHEGRRAHQENGVHVVTNSAKKIVDRARAATLIPTETPLGNAIYMEYFDHGNLPNDAIKAGLMVETLLQHVGVPYYAVNTYAGKEYAYVPEENRYYMPLTEQTLSIRDILNNKGLSGVEEELKSRGADEGVIREHLAKDPRTRRLLFGIPKNVSLSSLRSILEQKIKLETNPERLKGFEYLQEDIKFSSSSSWSLLSARAKLEVYEFEAIEKLRKILFSENLEERAKVENGLDMATDYAVIQKLKTEITAKIMKTRK